MDHLACPSIVPADRMSRSEISDAYAVQAVIGGSREMFEIIVRRYNRQLYRVGMAYLRQHAQTEDAMQNAYLKAFLHLDRFQGHAAFGTWLTRIMINECLMILRASKRVTMETIDDEEAKEACDALAVPPTDSLHDEDTRALLEKAVQALPRKHRAVYVLREIQHLSTAETAQCLGVSQANVKVLLHRAKEGLKQQLMRAWHAPSYSIIRRVIAILSPHG